MVDLPQLRLIGLLVDGHFGMILLDFVLDCEQLLIEVAVTGLAQEKAV